MIFKILWIIGRIFAVHRWCLCLAYLFAVTPKFRITKFGLIKLEALLCDMVQSMIQ